MITESRSRDNGKQVQRYIQLNKLIPELMKRLDNGQMAFNPSVHLSSLKEREQRQVLEAMEQLSTTPTVSQAQKIKRLSLDGQFSQTKVKEILCETKGEINRVTFKNEQLHKFFPRDYTPEKMKKEILSILKIWFENGEKL